MINISAFIPVACVFLLAEGGILDPRLDPEVDPGSLLKTGLGDSEVSTGVSRIRSKRSTPMERRTKIDTLCTVFEEFGHSGRPSDHQEYFRRTGRLGNINHRHLHRTLSRRRNETRECCRLRRNSRYVCFEDLHIRRVDNFCGLGSPDVPFPHHTQQWHNGRQNDCCFQLGFDRISCFKDTLPDIGPGEEQPLDDLDPADDTVQYLPPSEQMSQSSQSGQLDPMSENLALCCAAGEVGGEGLLYDKRQTCIRQYRRQSDSDDSGQCADTYLSCCIRRALGVVIRPESIQRFLPMWETPNINCREEDVDPDYDDDSFEQVNDEGTRSGRGSSSRPRPRSRGNRRGERQRSNRRTRRRNSSK